MAKLKYFLLTKSLGFYLNILVYIFPKKAQTLSYTLFSTPRKGKLQKDKLPSFLKNHVSEQLIYNNYTIQTYTWKGTTDVILLVHGWESNTSRWEKALPFLLTTGKTIIAIDAPAHGLTSGTEFNVPIYTEIIQVAINKFKPYAIIGHSIGGAAIIYNQYKYPNSNLKKIVLLGTPDEIHIILKNYVDLLSLNAANEKLFIAYFETNFNVCISTFAGSNFAKVILAKAMIVHDVDDNIVLFEEGKKLASAFTNSKFIETKSLGHSLHSAAIYNKIVSFIAE